VPVTFDGLNILPRFNPMGAPGGGGGEAGLDEPLKEMGFKSQAFLFRALKSEDYFGRAPCLVLGRNEGKAERKAFSICFASKGLPSSTSSL